MIVVTQGKVLSFWLPKYKHEFVDWLSRYYPKDAEGNGINWNKFTISKLTAIYISYRTKMEIQNYETQEKNHIEDPNTGLRYSRN